MKNILKKYIPIGIGKWFQLLYFFVPQKALHKAFVLFCTPRQGEVRPEQEYFLEAAEDEVVQYLDHEIQTYRWANTGETILLIHGWESNTYRWKALIEKLQAKNYNIIAFDAPAHGNSSGKLFHIPLYTEWIQKIVTLYRPNHIIGHSIGGMTSIYHQYVYKNPELEKLIILAPPSELATIMQGYKNTLRLSKKFMKAFDQYFKAQFGFHFHEFSIAEFTKHLSVPGLLVHDRYDKIASYLDVEHIEESWSGVVFKTTKNFGHSLYFDEVDDMILEFLE